MRRAGLPHRGTPTEQPTFTRHSRPSAHPQRRPFPPSRCKARAPGASRDPTVMATSNGTHCDADALGADVLSELEHLRAENEELRAVVLELEQALQSASGGQQDWEERAREYEGLLEEKSELIRNLHLRIQELEEAQPAEPAKPRGPLPREDELLTLSEELERERRQLREDEESLMEQMRQMEVQMAKERAEMARQRTDLSRLQNDLRHELEVAARDASLRE